MAYDNLGEGALDYFPCRYGNSKILFRGPRRKLDQPYVAMIGGTETYGKFIVKPFPALVEEMTSVRSVNFGCVNAGADVFINDPSVMEACSKARATVIQVVGAQNMSNRFYAVHPRRNDRFLRASALMKTIYREVDFTDFNFTRHMLSTLQVISHEKFMIVREELKEAWVARMKTLLSKIEGKTILLWLADHSPDDVDDTQDFCSDPLFVNRDMLERIRPLVTEIVEYSPGPAAANHGTEGMKFSAMEAPAASEMLGVVAHHEVAEALSNCLMRHL